MWLRIQQKPLYLHPSMMAVVDELIWPGINHPVLARFLYPIGEIARFDEDSKTQGLFFGLAICAADYTSERSNGCKKARSR
jgi:hypothetical protein